MIVSHTGAFGLSDLLRINGSAVYKVLLPVGVSTVSLLGYYWASGSFSQKGQNDFRHPYALGALIVFFSFLLTFRLNNAYARYWEATSACYQMQSRWLDCGMDIAAFHYQSHQYAEKYPRTFGEDQADDFSGLDKQPGGSLGSILRHRRRRRSVHNTGSDRGKGAGHYIPQQTPDDITYEKHLPIIARSIIIHDGSPTETQANSDSSSVASNENRFLKQPLPSPFLQECAHLLSLLSAVAYSTLRNTFEGTEIPLQEYEPGSPWPPEDPDSVDAASQGRFTIKKGFEKWERFLLGFGHRSRRSLILYHAARPLRVLGGVSDREMDMLNQARGSYAKMSLCTMWLQELISRECANGSTGNVAPPILSNLYAFISGGSDGYNQARQIAYTPFPFPHAQIASLYCFFIVFIFPVLYFTYVNPVWLACVLNGTTLTCFLGIHEVARELENPFTNEPNELPLPTWQAHFNEALTCMYAGYHPDSRPRLVPLRLANMSDDEESVNEPETNAIGIDVAVDAIEAAASYLKIW